MAHNLAQKNGQDAYVGRLAGWHQLGKVTNKYMTSEELRAEEVLADQWSAQRAMVRTMRHGEVTFEECYELSNLLAAAIEIKNIKHHAAAA